MNRPEGDDTPARDPVQRYGRLMVAAFWLVLLGGGTWAFQLWVDDSRNPNTSPEVRSTAGGAVEVVLERNRGGHYVVSGAINGESVELMLDTGASHVVVPASLERRLGLERGPSVPVQTANGRIDVYLTRLETLAIGPIRFTDVRASINPHMDGDAVLLGMSALGALELTQRGERLILRAPQ